MFGTEKAGCETVQQVSEDEIIDAIKKHRGLYMEIQIELMKRDCGSEVKSKEFNDCAVRWIDAFAAEYGETVHELVRRDINFFDKNKERDAVAVTGKRLDTIHEIEKLVSKDAPSDMERAFTRWHKHHSRSLLTILHNDPKLVDRFEETFDKNPEEREVLLKEIETKLYGAVPQQKTA